MPDYIDLLHGANSPNEELNHLGSRGSVLGDLPSARTSYATDASLETCDGVTGEFHSVTYL